MIEDLEWKLTKIIGSIKIELNECKKENIGLKKEFGEFLFKKGSEREEKILSENKDLVEENNRLQNKIVELVDENYSINSKNRELSIKVKCFENITEVDFENTFEMENNRLIREKKELEIANSKMVEPSFVLKLISLFNSK